MFQVQMEISLHCSSSAVVINTHYEHWGPSWSSTSPSILAIFGYYVLHDDFWDPEMLFRGYSNHALTSMLCDQNHQLLYHHHHCPHLQQQHLTSWELWSPFYFFGGISKRSNSLSTFWKSMWLLGTTGCATSQTICAWLFLILSFSPSLLSVLPMTGSHYMAQSGLEIMILLSRSS